MKADLHLHSTYSSDGKQSVQDIIHTCRAKGIMVISITDHNDIRGSLDAIRIVKEDMIVIAGMEITTSQGHILAYNIKEPIPQGKSVDETIGLIHAQGGIAVAPHPFRVWSGLGKKNVYGKKFDAIETMNGRSVKRTNARAAKLAKLMNIGVTGGSDAHKSEAIGTVCHHFPRRMQNG